VHRQGQGASTIRVRDKVSVATTAHRSKGGQFVIHIAALPGNPCDGHTLATVIPAMEDMIGNTIRLERDGVDAMSVLMASSRSITALIGVRPAL
jgi:hypothetical protein